MKLFRFDDGRIAFYCPGCEETHCFNNTWAVAGTDDLPTVIPSILCRGGLKHAEGRGGVCHTFITNGQIQFLTDCTHKLAGKIVPLPELSELKQ